MFNKMSSREIVIFFLCAFYTQSKAQPIDLEGDSKLNFSPNLIGWESFWEKSSLPIFLLYDKEKKTVMYFLNQ